MIGLDTVTSGAPVVGAILVPLAIHVAVRLKRWQDAALVLGLLVVPLLTIAVLATTTRGHLDPEPRRGLSRPRPRTDATRRPTVSEARPYRMTQSEAATE